MGNVSVHRLTKGIGNIRRADLRLNGKAFVTARPMIASAKENIKISRRFSLLKLQADFPTDLQVRKGAQFYRGSDKPREKNFTSALLALEV